MINTQQINDWVKDVIAALPAGLKNAPEDLQAHLRAALSQTLNKLNLVTAEEFEAQVQVLQKTRAKLELLEQRLAELEQRKS